MIQKRLSVNSGSLLLFIAWCCCHSEEGFSPTWESHQTIIAMLIELARNDVSIIYKKLPHLAVREPFRVI